MALKYLLLNETGLFTTYPEQNKLFLTEDVLVSS